MMVRFQCRSEARPPRTEAYISILPTTTSKCHCDTPPTQLWLVFQPNWFKIDPPVLILCPLSVSKTIQNRVQTQLLFSRHTQMQSHSSGPTVLLLGPSEPGAEGQGWQNDSPGAPPPVAPFKDKANLQEPRTNPALEAQAPPTSVVHPTHIRTGLAPRPLIGYQVRLTSASLLLFTFWHRMLILSSHRNPRYIFIITYAQRFNISYL